MGYRQSDMNVCRSHTIKETVAERIGACEISAVYVGRRNILQRPIWTFIDFGLQDNVMSLFGAHAMRDMVVTLDYPGQRYSIQDKGSGHTRHGGHHRG